MSTELLETPVEETVHRFRWTPKTFLQVAELGVFGHGNENEVELIDGEIVEKMPESELHAYTASVLVEILRQLFGPDFHAMHCRSLQFHDSQPIPDVVVLKGNARDYKGRFPRADEVALVVEVANTTLQFDLNQKLAMYARNGIAEYWVANVLTHEVTVFRNPDPASATYLEHESFTEGESISPLLGQDQSVSLVDIF